MIAPHLPPGKPLGRRRKTELRRVVDAMLDLLTTGCQWRLLPKDFPPATTVQRFFYGWRDDGTWRRINHHLLLAAREAGGPRGDDAGKKIPTGPSRRAGSAARTGSPALPSMGRKRHILTDSNGLLVAATVHAADIQDRDGAVPLLASIRHPFPWLRHVFADGGYAGAKLQTSLATLGTWTLAIVKRSDAATGFELLPRRWVVERTLAWLNRNRRLAQDFEALVETATAWLLLASVKLFRRRLDPMFAG